MKRMIGRAISLVLCMSLCLGATINGKAAEDTKTAATYSKPIDVVLKGWSEADGEIFDYSDYNWRTSDDIWVTAEYFRYHLGVGFDNSITDTDKKAYKYTWYEKVEGGEYKVISNLTGPLDDSTIYNNFTRAYWYCVVSAPDGSWSMRTNEIVVTRAYKATFVLDEASNEVNIWYKPYGGYLEMIDYPYDDDTFIGWRCSDDGETYKPGEKYYGDSEGVRFTPVYKSKTNMKLYFKDSDSIKCVAGKSRKLEVYFADDGSCWDFDKDPTKDLFEYGIYRNSKVVDSESKYGYFDVSGRLHFGTKCGKYYIKLSYLGNDNNTEDESYLDYVVVPASVKKSSIKISRKGKISTIKWGKSLGADKYKLNIIFKDGKKWPTEVTKKTKKKSGSVKKRYYRIKYKRAIKSVTITPIGAGLSGTKTKKKA